MAKENLAAIDLGTNSCRIIVADRNGHTLYRDSISTKLGEGMHANMRFTDEAITRGLDAFSEYANILKKYDVKKYRAIATASCRMASNGSEFIKRVEEKNGIKIETIDGYEEAILNLKGAILNADKTAKYVLIYDLGGGSTEITLATNEVEPKILHTISIPWGARNSAEAFDLRDYNEINKTKLHDEIFHYIADFIKNSEFEKYKDSCTLIATSSMPLRIASMIFKDEKYDRIKNDGAILYCKDIDNEIDNVCKMDLHERENSIYIGKNRAPIIIAGAIIFKCIYQSFGFDKLTASLKGAQEAIIKELMNNG